MGEVTSSVLLVSRNLLCFYVQEKSKLLLTAVCMISFVCRDYVKEWHDKKVSVLVWTANTSAEKNYFAGVLKCPIMTDCVRGDVESTTA